MHHQTQKDTFFGRWHARREYINNLIQAEVQGKNLRILEAGGGSSSYLKPLTEALQSKHITTIDISQEQLSKNDYADSKILGDLETYRFDGSKYDIIVCRHVLEHLHNPLAALENLCSVLDSNGLMFLAAPVPCSFSGLVTKFTPHSFHVFMYRRVFKMQRAGLPGSPPFKTIYEKYADPRNFIPILLKHGLAISHFSYFDGRGEGIRVRSRGCYLLYRSACVLLSVLSLGLWDPSLSDFHLILTRLNPGGTARTGG